jgi:hypothetical protein
MTITQLERQRSRRDVANVLAVLGLLALGVGYLAMFTVLGDTNYAVKFENGELPPGFDGSGGQFAAVMSVVAALVAFAGIVGAASIRTTKLVAVIIAVGLLAAMPYVPLALFTWSLAF